MTNVYAELVQRREALEKGHWVNHDPSGKGEICLAWDGCSKVLSVEAHRFLNDFLVESYNYRHGIVFWNDESGRTKDEVLAFLDRAIEKAYWRFWKETD